MSNTYHKLRLPGLVGFAVVAGFVLSLIVALG